MAALARLAASERDGWLSPLEHPGRRWWLVREETVDELSSTLADLMFANADEANLTWAVLVEGSADRLAYVTGTGLPMLRCSDARPPRTALGPLGTTEAVAVVDRAETAQVTAMLLLVDLQAAQGVVDALIRGDDAVAPEVVHMVALRRAAAPWAAVGLPADRPPDVPGAAVADAPAQLPSARSGGLTRRRGSPGRPSPSVLVAAGVAACIVAGGSWLAVRGQQRPATFPAAVAAPSASRAAPVPEPANQPSLGFDARHQQMVLYGGGEPAATWLWVGERWRPVNPAASPTDRFGAAMAWDPVAQRLVIFGGRELTGAVVDDTWAWDGSTWSRRDLGGPRPPGWEFSGMAWDVAHQQMVLLTPPNVGYGGGTAVTWTWSGGGWDRRAPALAPPAEPSTAMAFDPGTATVLLVLSGLSAGASPSTWSWDGTSWHHLHPLHEPDLGGFTSFLARVPGSPQLILTRVSVDPPQALQTWTWDGRDWTKQHPSVTPTGIVGLVTDDARGRVLAVGRRPRTRPLNLIWAWTGTNWSAMG